MKERSFEAKEAAEHFVSTAESYLGYNSNDGSHKIIIDIYNTLPILPRNYKVSYTDPWCATFVSAVGIVADLSSIIYPECGCENMIELYKSNGRWEERDSYIPAPGDIIMYDWDDTGDGDDTGYADHVGIVCSVNLGVMRVIEGNISNAVAYRDIPIDAKYIRGYCLPDFGYDCFYNPDPDTPQITDKLVRSVIRGDWGNGAARMEALNNAGYDWVEVQNAVNEYLSSEHDDSLKSVTVEVKPETFEMWNRVAKSEGKTLGSVIDEFFV